MSTQRHGRLAITIGLGVVAGIHLAVAATHAPGTVHGTFFAVAGLVQATLAIVAARTSSRAVIVAAAASSAALVGIWLVERSPAPGVLDTIATAAEAVVVLAGASVLSHRMPRAEPVLPRPAVVALLGVVAALSFAAAPAEHEHHDGAHEEPAHAQSRFDELLLDHHAPAPPDPHRTGAPHGH